MSGSCRSSVVFLRSKFLVFNYLSRFLGPGGASVVPGQSGRVSARVFLSLIVCSCLAQSTKVIHFEFKTVDLKILEESNAGDRQLENRALVYHNSVLEQHLLEITAPLLLKDPLDGVRRQFHILRDPGVNAFALPTRAADDRPLAGTIRQIVAAVDQATRARGSATLPPSGVAGMMITESLADQEVQLRGSCTPFIRPLYSFDARDAKFCIDNICPSSQAGRRGFEVVLPLRGPGDPKRCRFRMFFGAAQFDDDERAF